MVNDFLSNGRVEIMNFRAFRPLGDPQLEAACVLAETLSNSGHPGERWKQGQGRVQGRNPMQGHVVCFWWLHTTLRQLPAEPR